MKVNDIIYGFKVVSSKEIKDINSKLIIFKHEKSGITLAYLDNEDTNKVFSCGFRTLPEDSTGVCHIIEHSVLSGSKKYPLKEPFVNLLKGSMATFINAMTAQDWTIYPVASQNDKDFDNLVSSYLDACFAPMVIEDPKAFLQEGWHIEMKNHEDTPIIKGVVYNEMKGATSSVDEQLMQATQDAIYEGTGYGVNSGGDPDVIPTLTYEYFKDFYKLHYHPENALMYLYGKMNIEEKLKFIDEEYLSKFTMNNNRIHIDVPQPVININVRKEYAINDEDIKDNTYASLGFALDEYKNYRDLQGFIILDEALMKNNTSPLKKALLDSKLGQDIQTYVNDDCIKPSYFVFLKKSNEDMVAKFNDVLINECKKIVEKGIDKNLLLGVISNLEFRFKEMDMGRTPKGLIYFIWAMQCFIYDIPLEKGLEYEDNFKFYKENLEKGYFEGLIEKYILNSNHKVSVTLVPSKTLEKEREAQMNKKMNDLKESLSEEQVDEIVKTTNELIAYQSKNDTPEELRLLPTLELSDIPLDINTLNTQLEESDNTRFVKHEFNTNGISYLKLYFDLNTLLIDELPYIKLLPSIFEVMDTEKYDSFTLQNIIKTYLGSLDCSFQSTSNGNEVYANFITSVSALDENVRYISEVLDQLFNHILFDEEKFKVILNQAKLMERNKIIQGGMATAINQVAKSCSKQGCVLAKTSGTSYLAFLDKASSDVSSTIETLKKILQKVINKNNLIVSLSGTDEEINKLLNVFEQICINKQKYELKLNDIVVEEATTEALIIPSQVNYNAKGFSLNKIGVEYSGKLLVLAHIIHLDYLWSEIRVKGGAYGCSLSIRRNGDCIFGSYRDPNVSNTYEVYDNTAKYLEQFNPSKEEFKSYLIGAIGSFDGPESNNSKIFSTDYRMISGYTNEERIKIKNEMLNTTLEDIRECAIIFKHLANDGSTYTIGNETKIKEYNNFKKITNL